MVRRRNNTATFVAPVLPEVGTMVHVATGPCMYRNGVVLAHVNDRWGAHALVLMHNGKIKTCKGLNNRPGIGWHAGAHVNGYYDGEYNMDDMYSNYD